MPGAAHIDRPINGLLLNARQFLIGADGRHCHRLGIFGAQPSFTNSADGEIIPGAGIESLADEAGLSAVHCADQIILIFLLFLRVIPEDIVFDRGVIAMIPCQLHAVAAGCGGQVLGNTWGLVYIVDNIAHHRHLVTANLNVPGGKLPLEAVIRVSGGNICHGAGTADLRSDGLCAVAAPGMTVACADHKAAGTGSSADLNVVGIARGKGLALLPVHFLGNDGVAL